MMPPEATLAERKRKHPKGLFQLFFIEMFERLAFYTMLNILLLYALDFEREGLGLPAGQANEIYGLYLAFVYFTPFPGGMLADRYLGFRKAVLIGGLTMASGLFMLSIPGKPFFYGGLIALCLGNGLLKPNISAMVGNLYEPGDPNRDSGFNIFYMGINIGAFTATVLGIPFRNYLGWLWTFRIAGIGLLIGMVGLLLSWKLLESADRRSDHSDEDTDDASFGDVALKVLLPALVFGVIGWLIFKDTTIGFVIGMVPVIFFFVRLAMTSPEKERPGLIALLLIYVAGGTFFMILHLNGSAMTQWAKESTRRDIPLPTQGLLGSLAGQYQETALPSYYSNGREDLPRPAPESLLVVEDPTVQRMFGQRKLDESTLTEILADNPDVQTREFEPSTQAFSLSADDRAVFQFATGIYADGQVTVSEQTDSHGAKSLSVDTPAGVPPRTKVAFIREGPSGPYALYVISKADFDAMYLEYEKKYGKPPPTLEPGEWATIVNPEFFLGFNALFVIAFTPLVVGFFAWMAARANISTGRKIFFGLCMTCGSLLLMALAGTFADGGATKVSGLWLVGFYAIVTIGELLLSPMGLSLVTKLSPKRLVGLCMGGWFIATAFGNKFSGFFGGVQGQMTPVSFFLLLAGITAAVAVFIRVMLPRLDAAIENT